MKKDKILKIMIISWSVLFVLLQFVLYLINYYGITKYNYIFWSITNSKPQIKLLIYSFIVLILTVLVSIKRINILLLNYLKKIFEVLNIKRKYLFFTIISILFLFLSYKFRLVDESIRREHWGILIVKQALTDPSKLFFMSAPITSYLEYLFFKITSYLFHWSVTKAIDVFGILMSSFYIFVFLLFADLLGKNKLQKFLLFLLFLSSGFSQILFGWIEGPVFGVFWMIIFLYVSNLYINKRVKFIYVVLSFLLGFWSYAAFFWFIPSLLFLFFLNSRIYRLSLKNFIKGILSKKFVKFILIILIPTILFLIFMEINLYTIYKAHIYHIEKVKVGNLLGGGDGIIFIELFKIKSNWEKFTFFSTGHLIEFLNMNLLLAPFGGVLFFSLIFLYKKEINFKNPFVYFMLIILSFFLLFMITYNLDYLDVKEAWDIYAIIHIIYTVINSFILINYTEKNTYEEIVLIMIFVSFSLSIPWILSNSSYAYLIINK